MYDDPDDDTKNRRNVFSDDVTTIFEARAKATGKILQKEVIEIFHGHIFLKKFFHQDKNKQKMGKKWQHMNKVVY